MTTLWNYDPTMTFPDTELVGFDVEATDGSIGKVDQASRDVDDAWVIVDTGFWIFGTRRVLPARLIRQINPGLQKVFLSVSTEQVKDAPDVDPDWTTDPASRARVGDYYAGLGS
jgi:hypothetical protein